MSAKTKEKLKLFINTSDNKKTLIKLNDLGIVETYKNPREQRLLELIDKIIKKAGVNKEDISDIKINTGPGSFTGLRVGCSVANTLTWALGIKANNKNFVEPKYE